MTSTNAIAEVKEETVRIKAGQSASFPGYLVPEWQFRKINEELTEKDILKKNLETRPTVTENKIEPFLWGLLTGAVSILIVDKFSGGK